jgi:hypothetical protein
MAALKDLQVQGDHRQRKTDLALWRCDVGFWRQEARKALADLRRLEAALREHERALEAHAEGLSTHEELLNAHADFLPESGGCDDLDGWIAHASHQHQASKHVRERESHERIKRRHHTLMAYWSLLLDVLGQV